MLIRGQSLFGNSCKMATAEIYIQKTSMALADFVWMQARQAVCVLNAASRAQTFQVRR